MRTLILIAFFMVVTGCGDAATTDEATDTTADTTETTADTTETTTDDATTDADADASCESVPLPEAPAAAGQLTFKLDVDIDPCSVGGYIVGYNELLKVKKADDGTYFINDVPDGEHDVVITAGTLVLSLTDKEKDRGKRHKKIPFLNGVRTEKEEIDLPKMGSMSGVVKLNDQTDHAGIDVYIPGTEYIAKTDSEGKYAFSVIPVGEHNLYFEKDGYHRGQIEAVEIESEVNKEITEITLVISTGAEGFIQIQDGKDYHNSKTVNLTIVATSEAVLMAISESNTFDNASWIPIITSTSYTFETDGEKTIYVRFANSNGLESNPSEDSITIDTTNPVFTISSFCTVHEENMIISINATDANLHKLKIAKNSDFEIVSWEDFSATKSMPYEENIKVQVKDKSGNKSEILEHRVARPAILSQARHSLAATTVGTKALFAGGYTNNGRSNIVDIYDSNTNTWSAATLSQARGFLSATTIGTKAMFVGGYSSLVDIYDSNTNTWSTTNLSQARGALAATTVQTKALFAGGRVNTGSNLAVVDIYDSNTNTWSTADLTQARYSLAATTVGTKALFAGGYTNNARSNIVDIYDSNTNTWSAATLSVAREALVATSAGTKALFAGGRTDPTGAPSNVVDIYDSNTNTWSTATLTQARFDLVATSIGTKAIFAGGRDQSDLIDVVDIYDSNTNTWSTTTLTQAGLMGGATSIGTKAIFVGGYSSADLSTVNGNSVTDTIDIYDLSTNTWSTEMQQ